MIPGVQNYIDAEKQKVTFLICLIVPVLPIFLLLLIVVYLRGNISNIQMLDKPI